LLSRRFSSVNQINIISVGNTSTVEIGDSERLNLLTNALALQREKAIFLDEELEDFQFPLFQKEIPLPTVKENISITISNDSPFIQVDSINITSIAASSVVHIGSTETIQAEARVKHIRHLLQEDRRKK
jgi:spore germination protein PE